MISKSQINRIGKQIRKKLNQNDVIIESDLELLQNYRISFQSSLNAVFDFLVLKSKYHYKGSLTVYRLKRIDTIIRKIKRFPTMSLSKMQDIAGCRSIVGSESQIYKIVKDFEENSQFEIIDRADYIKDPRETGYVSYHLIVKPIDSERFVEIQLRTRAHHSWATLVEITDLIFNVKLKEGEDHLQLYNFHKLLAKRSENFSESDMIKLISIEREFNLISKLISLFKSNYYVSIDRWGKSLINNSQYLLMELDQNFSPKFIFFSDFIEAENVYFQNFTRNEPNLVLIHITKPNFEKIGLAYSNYVLTSHPYIQFYLEILQNLILLTKNSQNIVQSKNYLAYYEQLVQELLNSFKSEIEFMNNIIEELKLSKTKNEEYTEEYIKLVGEWNENLRLRLQEIDRLNINFSNKLGQYLLRPNMPKNSVWRMLRSILRL